MEIVRDAGKALGHQFPRSARCAEKFWTRYVLSCGKYQETIAKGFRDVIRLSKELSSMGEPQDSFGSLIQLYDSHGLSPEIVKEVAEKQAWKCKYQTIFSRSVAERHLKNCPEGQRQRTKTDWPD